MKPALISPTRPTSERRAAALRANGPKSRRPVTAVGKANSSRNSHRCQYDRAVHRLTALRAHGIFKKMNIHERPQQVVENTAPHSAPTHPATMDATESKSAGNPNPKKVILYVRTQQAAENTTPPPQPTHQTTPAYLTAARG